MNHQLLMAAIQDFVSANGKDERFKDAVEQLQGVHDSLQQMVPDAGPSPGSRAVTAANTGREDDNRPPAPEQAAETQPKTFSVASQAARERMQEARAA